MIKSRYSAVETLKVMGKASKKVMGPTIHVLLWNVFKCKKRGWESDFLTLAEGKDLILLQEAVLNSPYDGLFLHSTKHQWIMASSFKNLKSNIETGVKTGASVLADQHFCSASVYGEPLTNTKKMVLVTEYPLVSGLEDGAKKTLLVINTHLINFVSFAKFKSHLDQAFQALTKHRGPILLAGDFNTWHPKRMAYFSALADENSLQEVTLNRQPRAGHFFQHLDHVFCRDLSVVEVEVHSNVHSSDHFPITLCLRC